jgi:hypothetical protein
MLLPIASVLLGTASHNGPKRRNCGILVNRRVETVEDRLIHSLDASKRSITVADYVAMPKMFIRGEPYVRHVSCELPSDLAPFQ